MEKEAAELWVQLQLEKRRDGFKPPIFAKQGYYILKDFLPPRMQALLLREAVGLLEKSKETPTHILSCRKQVTMLDLPFDQQSKTVMGAWEECDAVWINNFVLQYCMRQFDKLKSTKVCLLHTRKLPEGKKDLQWLPCWMHHDYVGLTNAANDSRPDDEKSRFLIIPLEKDINIDILKFQGKHQTPNIVTITVQVGQALVMSHAVYHRTGPTDRKDRNLRIHVSLTRSDKDQSNDVVDYLTAPYYLKEIKLTPAEVKATGLDCLTIKKDDLHEDVRSLPSDLEDDDGEEDKVRTKQKSLPEVLVQGRLNEESKLNRKEAAILRIEKQRTAKQQ